MTYTDQISSSVARAIYTEDLDKAVWSIPRVYVLISACYLGNWRLAAVDDEEERLAKQPPLNDEEWW